MPIGAMLISGSPVVGSQGLPNLLLHHLSAARRSLLSSATGDQPEEGCQSHCMPPYAIILRQARAGLINFKLNVYADDSLVVPTESSEHLTLPKRSKQLKRAKIRAA